MKRKKKMSGRERHLWPKAAASIAKLGRAGYHIRIKAKELLIQTPKGRIERYVLK
jgi:hypothetical protein